MKRFLLIISSVLIIGSFASARYKTNKEIYDYPAYTHRKGDPYPPALAAGISLLLPGFGQIISGEFAGDSGL